MCHQVVIFKCSYSIMVEQNNKNLTHRKTAAPNHHWEKLLIKEKRKKKIITGTDLNQVVTTSCLRQGSLVNDTWKAKEKKTVTKKMHNI